MARSAYSKEKYKQEDESEQVHHFKQLLVTLKIQYEKHLQNLQVELNAEQTRNKELSTEFSQYKSFHEEELVALRNQQTVLRDLLKKAQTTVAQENAAEIGLLKNDLEQAQKKIQELEATREKERTESRAELDQLHQQLAIYEDREDQQEIISSHTSSFQLRRELDLIKQTFVQGREESKNLEKRYTELFSEKVGLESQIKQLQTQIEHQSSNLVSFEGKIEELNEHKKKLESIIQEKEACLLQEAAKQQELTNHIQKMEEQCREKSILQEKYEQLKDEFMLLSNSQEETFELRLQAEQRMLQLDALAKEQESQLSEKNEELTQLTTEREHLHADLNHIHELLAETESHLKTAQQHLAKKVKEGAILAEKVSEQQNTLVEYHHINESTKAQLNQLQGSLELYQKQEKRLQEQLHEALKGTEHQVAKWESKYFEMYEKWQKSENQIAELKKVEEKHLQMQHLLSNLGNFMGSSISPTQLFQAMQAPIEPKMQKISDFDVEPEVPEALMSNADLMEEKYDMFGMRHTEKPKQPPFS